MLNTYDSPYVSQYDSNYDPFGSLTLTADLYNPQSFVEPLSLDDVKGYLRLSTTLDNSEDLTLSLLISAAREQAELLQNRDLVLKQWDLSYDYWPQYRIPLRAPTVSVDLITYKDLTGTTTTMVENTDYTVDLKKQPGIITPPWNQSWPAYTPWPSSSVLVRFTSGLSNDSQWWSETGSKVKIGMLLLISAWYENRLPFTPGARNDAEMPYAVTCNLSAGRLERAR